MSSSHPVANCSRTPTKATCLSVCLSPSEETKNVPYWEWLVCSFTELPARSRLTEPKRPGQWTADRCQQPGPWELVMYYGASNEACEEAGTDLFQTIYTELPRQRAMLIDQTQSTDNEVIELGLLNTMINLLALNSRRLPAGSLLPHLDRLHRHSSFILVRGPCRVPLIDTCREEEGELGGGQVQPRGQGPAGIRDILL